MNIGILGGGLSGVTLQRFLTHNSEILEKENRPGGLCRTFQKDGFSYDIGGHILFSKDNIILDMIKEILGENINYCKRSNKIYYKGLYVKYPFENGLGILTKEDIYECLIGYIKNNHPEPANFLEWIYYTFGDGIAEKYLVPYNKKIWKTPLDEMSLEWVERVPKPPVEDIIKSALGIETEGYTHQLYFNYPSTGGIEELIKSMIKENSNITTDFEVKKISRYKDRWVVSDGKEEKYYDKIVVTFPVKETIKCIDNMPEQVIRSVNSLKHNSVRVILIGINNEALMDKSAVYIPQSNIIAHRVCYMGYFSKHNVPEGKSSLIAEVTTNKVTGNIDDSLLIEMVVNDLDKTGIINKKDVIITDIRNFEYGYVVYDMNYTRNITMIKDYFSGIGIELLGRFAEFEYINMDEVIKRARKLAEKINYEA